MSPFHRSRIVVIVACLLAGACNSAKKSQAARPAPTQPGQPVAQEIGVRIGPEGGSLTSRDGRVAVRVPPGALAAPTTFTAQEISNTAPSGLGSAYRLGPEGTTFVRPVTFTFVSGWSGAPVDRLTIATRDPATGYWTSVPSVRRDVGARTLTIETTHFSDWAIVGSDPLRDMAGSFRIASSTDGSVFSTTQATLTYSSQDALERIYLLGGTTTVQPPVSANGVACTLTSPASGAMRTNIAEVFNTPDRFWWGTSGFWNVSDCGAREVTMAFDTAGQTFLGCTRGYVPTEVSATPIVTLDRLQGAYQIDCGGGRAVSASWDFFRCGGGCQSTNVCHTAAYVCGPTGPVCTDDGNVQNGTECGTSAVCGAGTCNACTQDAPCTPANNCHAGRTECSSGFPVCVDTGTPLAQGTTCGTNAVCNLGTCNACTAGSPCDPGLPLCHTGVTSCATGVQTCGETTAPKPNGTACGTDQVCNGGACTACKAGDACTPTNPCHVGRTDCSTGVLTCADTGQPVGNGVACNQLGTPEAVCNAGTCALCQSGLACAPDACHTGTTSCGTGTQTCAGVTTLANGTACGTNLVCNGGACTACVAGEVCTPANPCHAGITSCATGVRTCNDTGTPKDDGTSCGTNAVCNAGTCSPCTAGVACTPANPCHTGTTSCATGASTCVDSGTSVANGAACGAAQVCFAGTCGPCTQGADCALLSAVEACSTTTTIECSSGQPVCTARAALADAPPTSCGPDASTACVGGSCLAVTCDLAATTPASCIPANPCHVGTVACGATGAPTGCTDTAAAMPDGTTCGTDLVCRTGTCLACPAAAGAACTTTNPCATSAAIQCLGAIPTCVDTVLVPDGTNCGTNLTCQQGVCK